MTWHFPASHLGENGSEFLIYGIERTTWHVLPFPRLPEARMHDPLCRLASSQDGVSDVCPGVLRGPGLKALRVSAPPLSGGDRHHQGAFSTSETCYLHATVVVDENGYERPPVQRLSHWPGGY